MVDTDFWRALLALVAPKGPHADAVAHADLEARLERARLGGYFPPSLVSLSFGAPNMVSVRFDTEAEGEQRLLLDVAPMATTSPERVALLGAASVRAAAFASEAQARWPGGW
jgi:hypothetical protein